ncbi:MAG TPA: MFS transporter, partial [Rhodocyclaceae bacterium]|nr:MFS transporter [Rhodocyclaceae bacterium]
SVTIGSVVNGRLIPRLAHPERLFSYGVIVLFFGLGMLATVTATTAHFWLMAIFAVCGFSLGFQLPNLTLQIQASVGKADQGAASALIQTLRTLGSMFGASLAGLVVSLGFTRGSVSTLAQEGIHNAEVLQLFESPQLLVRAADQETLMHLAQQQGFDAVHLLEQARVGLVSGIHQAFLGCLVLVVMTYFISRHLPAFTRPQKPVELDVSA